MPPTIDLERLAYLRSVFGTPPVVKLTDIPKILADLERKEARWLDILDQDEHFAVHLHRVIPYGDGALVLFRDQLEEQSSDRVAYIVAGEMVWVLCL